MTEMLLRSEVIEDLNCYAVPFAAEFISSRLPWNRCFECAI
jgi:hypothetical protein